MKWIVYLVIFIILGLWIYLRKKKMVNEKIQLETWLGAQGLICYREDSSDLSCAFRDNQWILNPDSIYDVIPVKHRSATFYLFSSDIMKSSRRFRTYGSILLSVPFYGSFFMMSGSPDDLGDVIELKGMKKVAGTEKTSLHDLCSIYAGNGADALEIIKLIEPAILKSGIGDLIIETRNGRMLILRDEYFTPDDITMSLELAKSLLAAMNPEMPRTPEH